MASPASYTYLGDLLITTQSRLLNEIDRAQLAFHVRGFAMVNNLVVLLAGLTLLLIASLTLLLRSSIYTCSRYTFHTHLFDTHVTLLLVTGFTLVFVTRFTFLLLDTSVTLFPRACIAYLLLARLTLLLITILVIFPVPLVVVTADVPDNASITLVFLLILAVTIIFFVDTVAFIFLVLRSCIDMAPGDAIAIVRLFLGVTAFIHVLALAGKVDGHAFAVVCDVLALAVMWRSLAFAGGNRLHCSLSTQFGTPTGQGAPSSAETDVKKMVEKTNAKKR